MGIYSNETALNQRTGSYVASQVRVSDSHRGTDTAPRVSTSVSHSGDSVGQSHDQSQGQNDVDSLVRSMLLPVPPLD